MIKKIGMNEYLRRYDDMTADERQAYMERVGQWLSDDGRMLAEKTDNQDARLKNIQSLSADWNDAECQAFEEGARLLSALAGSTDTWLPDMLYVKAARRVVKRMYEVLWSIEERHDSVMSSDPSVMSSEVETSQDQEISPLVPLGRDDREKEGRDDREKGGRDDEGRPTKTFPVRPKHIDQYVHLLPEKTQERAAQVKGLYLELEDAREKMRLLMDDQTAKDTDREAWAKKATSIDNRLKKIFDELDSEWNKLVEAGRVEVDDLGNARIIENPEVRGGSQTDNDEEKQELTSEQKARRRELRKWLVDTRRGNGDTREEHIKKWQENFKEYLTLEGEAAYEDDKIKAAATHYGIELTQH